MIITFASPSIHSVQAHLCLSTILIAREDDLRPDDVSTGSEEGYIRMYTYPAKTKTRPLVDRGIQSET